MLRRGQSCRTHTGDTHVLGHVLGAVGTATCAFLPSASSLRPRMPRFVATRLGHCLRTCLLIRVWRSKINAKTNFVTYSFKTLQEFRLHRCLHWGSLSWISGTRVSSLLASSQLPCPFDCHEGLILKFFVEETQSVNNDFRCCVEAKVAGPTRGTHTCLVLLAPPHVLFTVRLVLASSHASFCCDASRSLFAYLFIN